MINLYIYNTIFLIEEMILGLTKLAIKTPCFEVGYTGYSFINFSR